MCHFPTNEVVWMDTGMVYRYFSAFLKDSFVGFFETILETVWSPKWRRVFNMGA